MDHGEVKKIARTYRKELIPMLKKLGFNASVTTKDHYWKSEMNVVIKNVPTNFHVWAQRHSRWDLMDKAERLRSSIKNRMNALFGDGDGVSCSVTYNRNIPFKEYEGYDGS